MLVISRKIDESVIIDKNIIIKIVDIDKNQVRIGIEAPKNITILREELVKEIAKTNKLASQHNADDIENLHEVLKQ